MLKLPRSVQVVVYRHRDGRREYLLLLRTRPGAEPFWQPVSGSLEPGESSLDAARREVREESGFAVDRSPVDLGLVSRFRIADAWRDRYPDGVFHNIQESFAVEVGKGEVRLDEREHAAFRWEPLEIARELVHYEPNRRALQLVGAGFARGVRRPFVVPLGKSSLELGESTLVMGVLNVTPDSFSDGGAHYELENAVEAALHMQSAGARIIDVGGESTRPGAAPVSPGEEAKRVVPVIAALATKLHIPISIDTRNASTAAAAIKAGAAIVNDVSALGHDAEMARVVARTDAALVLMHMRGTPETMQTLEPSLGVLGEIELRLMEAVETAVDAGIPLERLILDPGIGFGKTGEQNLEVLRHLDRIAALDRPVLVGTSRKSFLGTITGKTDPADRVMASAASAALAVSRGAHIVRVHDVAESIDAVRVADALARPGL